VTSTWGLSGAGVRRSILVFAVPFVPSLPEGFAIGTAYASDTEGLGLFVILAIALQNLPSGSTQPSVSWIHSASMSRAIRRSG
jgi:zinc transporter ZupT